MRIGRLFAVSMLSVTVLAVILGAGVLVPQYRTFAGKTEAIKAVEAYGTVLAVGQQVAGYRAPYVGPLFQEGAATQAQLEAAAKAVQTADAAFAKARTAVGALSDGAVDRPGPQPGGGQTGRGSRGERSRDGVADERARSGGDERLPAGHCRGCRDSRTAVEPA